MTESNPEYVLIRCGLLADGMRTSAVPDQAVIVRNGRIDSVGPQSEISSTAPADTAIVDLGDDCLIPGLIDVHTHASLPADGGNYAENFAGSDELMSIIGVMNVKRHLEAGITTIREHGARNKVGFVIREGVRRGYVPGPRMLVSGRPITCTNGHFHFCNETADGEEAIRDSVRRLLDEGADYIKIMASGGGTADTEPSVPSYSTEELRAAVTEAHKFGRLTAAHCRSTESIRRAVEAGVDLIEHVEFLDSDGEVRLDLAIVESMVESDAYLSPTLQAFTSYPRYFELDAMRKDGTLSPAKRDELSALDTNRKTRLGIVRGFVAAGLGNRLVAGSDAGPNRIEFGHIDYDVRLLRDAGLTEAEALQATTRVAADAIGLGREIGTIEVGKTADFAAVDGDPTKDISAVSRVTAVFQAGVRVR
jgi:imidazolonepropionase-like amidohydrolase